MLIFESAMKGALASTLSILIVAVVLTLPSLAQPTAQASGAPSSSSSDLQPQTIAGRIVRLDVKSAAISVRSNDTGKVLDLKVAKSEIVLLRQGQRVIVTYSGRTATKIEATRSVK